MMLNSILISRLPENLSPFPNFLIDNDDNPITPKFTATATVGELTIPGLTAGLTNLFFPDAEPDAEDPTLPSLLELTGFTATLDNSGGAINMRLNGTATLLGSVGFTAAGDLTVVDGGVYGSLTLKEPEETASFSLQINTTGEEKDAIPANSTTLTMSDDLHLEIHASPAAIGLEMDFDLSTDSSSNLPGMRKVLSDLGLPGKVFDWLDTGLLEFPVEADGHVALDMYSPGFDQEANTGTLKRDGGIRVDALGTLTSSLGSVTGDLQFDLSSNDVTGSFAGWGTLSFEPWFNIHVGTPENPALSGDISSYGCLKIDVDTPPFDVAPPFYFPLAAGACEPQLSVGDVTLLEGDFGTDTTVSVPVVIEQIREWKIPDAQLLVDYTVQEDGATEDDYSLPTESDGRLVIGITDYDSTAGSASRTIDIIIHGDNEAEDGEESIAVTVTGVVYHQDIQLADPQGRVTIFDDDVIGVPRPQAPLLYDFQEDGDGGTGFSAEPDPDPESTLNASVFHVSSTHLPLASATGLPDAADDGKATTGRAGRKPLPGFSPFVPATKPPAQEAEHPDLPAGYEFTIHPDSAEFVPGRLDFWDKPRGTAETDWDVYAIVGYDWEWPYHDFQEPIELDLKMLFEYDVEIEKHAETLPEDLAGWRRWRADMGRILCDPGQPMPAVPPMPPNSPWACFAKPTPITFRLVPNNASELQWPDVDNVVVDGGPYEIGGSYEGVTQQLIDLADGRQLAIGIEDGPGEWSLQIGQAPDPGNIDPVPEGAMSMSVHLIGTDANSRFTMSLSGNSGDPTGAENHVFFNHFSSADALNTLNLGGINTVSGNFSLPAGVAAMQVHNVTGGSDLQLKGDDNGRLEFSSSGLFGNDTRSSRNGVNFDVAGTLNFQGNTVLGGQWSMDAADTVSTTGDFGASVDIVGDFQEFNIQGDLLSSEFKAGSGAEKGEVSSGRILVGNTKQGTGGRIHVGSLEVDGNLELLQGSGDFDVDLRTTLLGTLSVENSLDQDVTLDGFIKAGSVGTIATVGGNMTATVVTTDSAASLNKLAVLANEHGRGGQIDSRHSFHLAGGVQNIIAEQLAINLVAGGHVDSITATGSGAAEPLTGRLQAGSFGRIVVHGDAGFSAIATATETQLGETPAIEEITILQGNWTGGAVVTAPGTDLKSLTTQSDETGQGGIHNLVLDVGGDLGKLTATADADLRGFVGGSVELLQVNTGDLTASLQANRYGAFDVPDGQTDLELTTLRNLSENLLGASAGDLLYLRQYTDDPGSITLSDDRFEIVQDQIRLKDDVSLDLADGETIDVVLTATSDVSPNIRISQVLRVRVLANPLPVLDVSTEQRPTITWTSVSEATSYEIRLEQYGSSNNPLINTTVSETSYTLTEDLGIGVYETWLQATLPNDVKTTWARKTFKVNLAAQLTDLPYRDPDRTPTISWDPVPGALQYRLYVSNLTVGGPPVLDELTTETSFTPTEEFGFGRYRIWCRAIGVGNYAAAWSTPENYYVGPDPLSSASSTFNDQPTFQWESIPGISSYQLYVQQGRTVPINVSGLTETSYTPAAPLGVGLHRWWVRPFHESGRAGDWSRHSELFVGGRPQLTAPSGTVNDSPPTISWEPVEGAGSYEVYLYNDDGLGLVYRRKNITQSQIQVPPTPDGSYRVWIKSYRADGNHGLWSRSRSFVIDAATSPVTATPVSPLTATFDRTPAFVWDGSSQAVSYDLYLTDGTDIVEFTGSSTSFVPQTNLAIGDWKWWVRAVDGNSDKGEWSAEVSVHVGGRPNVLAPMGSINTTTPTIRWTAVEGAGRYILLLETLAGVSVFRDNNLTATEYTLDVAPGEYRIWVKAISADDDFSGFWSHSAEFSIARINHSLQQEKSRLDVTLIDNVGFLPTVTPDLLSDNRQEADVTHETVAETAEVNDSEPVQQNVIRIPSADPDVGFGSPAGGVPDDSHELIDNVMITLGETSPRTCVLDFARE